MNLRPLTKRQREIFDFICFHINHHGFAPTLEDICKRFGLSAIATAHKHLASLQDKGYIVRRWNHGQAKAVADV